MSAQVWRVECDGDAVLSCDVRPVEVGEGWMACDHGEPANPQGCRAGDSWGDRPLTAVAAWARWHRLPVVALVAPGESTRAEMADEVARLREALRFLCRADVGPCDFCGATATKRDGSAPLTWWCDVCAPPDAVDHEHAATLRPLLPPRGAK